MSRRTGYAVAFGVVLGQISCAVAGWRRRCSRVIGAKEMSAGLMRQGYPDTTLVPIQSWGRSPTD